MYNEDYICFLHVKLHKDFLFYYKDKDNNALYTSDLLDTCVCVCVIRVLSLVPLHGYPSLLKLNGCLLPWLSQAVSSFSLPQSVFFFLYVAFSVSTWPLLLYKLTPRLLTVNCNGVTGLWNSMDPSFWMYYLFIFFGHSRITS